MYHPERYPWAFNFNKLLSETYILLRPSPNFAKARPIVNYSRSWPKQMGFVLSIVLQDILKAVYTSVLSHHNICSVMKEIAYVFHSVCQWLRLVFAANWHWWILQSSRTWKKSSVYWVCCPTLHCTNMVDLRVSVTSACIPKGKSTTSFLRTVACEDLRCIGLYVSATLFLFVNFC